MFYILGGLTHADSGRVLIDGIDFSALSDSARTRMRKSKIGFIFQKFNLLPTLTAEGNIAIARDIAGKSDGAAERQYIERITRLLGVDNRLAHRPSELSGGEQQRVALARALVNQPAIVLADEPTGSLDSQNSEIVLNMLRQSNEELSQTVLMITHNPEAAKYGDRIIHMRDGSIVPPEQDPQWEPRRPRLNLRALPLPPPLLSMLFKIKDLYRHYPTFRCNLLSHKDLSHNIPFKGLMIPRCARDFALRRCSGQALRAPASAHARKAAQIVKELCTSSWDGSGTPILPRPNFKPTAKRRVCQDYEGTGWVTVLS